MTNGHALTVKIITYGGIITAIETPDREGKTADIALGKADLAGYLADHPNFGAICGRVAGRITAGKFSLDGKDYQLALNNGAHHLHGGEKGLDKVLWQPEVLAQGDAPKLRLRYRDPAGHNGYPGNLDCSVDYSLTTENELVIEYRFSTDQATPLAVTNHSYFNLKGEGRGTILDHEIQIFGDEVSLADADMALLDQRASVDGKANDFRVSTLLSKRINDLHEQHGDGYFLPGGRTDEPRLVARFREATSGRVLETLTTEPYGQFYTSAQMEDGEPGKHDGYVRFSGLCFETHPYPNSVNAPELGDGVLYPGEDFYSKTIYRFLTE